MNIIDCIKKRRSRRQFTNREVTDEVIEKIIEAGIYAPSSRDCQPWQFIVVRDQDSQFELARLKSEGNQEHILSAPVTLMVCVDTSKSPNSFIEDGVCAVQNMLLVIEELGLGAVYVSAGSKTDPEITNEIRNILSVPKNVVPLVLLPLGYPDQKEKLHERKLLDTKKVIHKNRW